MNPMGLWGESLFLDDILQICSVLFDFYLIFDTPLSMDILTCLFIQKHSQNPIHHIHPSFLAILPTVIDTEPATVVVGVPIHADTQQTLNQQKKQQTELKNPLYPRPIH